MLDAEGRLDRGALRARVFRDEAARRQLEALLHPLILEAGEVWKVEDLELEQAFLAALEDFRSRYTLQYTARVDAPGTWHDIDVRVRVPGAKVRVREGYLRGDDLP